MSNTDQAFEIFARGLVPPAPQVDPEAVRQAREWYKQFTGTHAVIMDDRDLVQIYFELH